MKKLIVLMIMMFCCLQFKLFAAVYIFKNDNGIRFYHCDALGAGGRVGVKFAGKGKYRITGGFKTGMIYAGSLMEAARIACDEAPERESTNNPSTSKQQTKQ